MSSQDPFDECFHLYKNGQYSSAYRIAQDLLSCCNPICLEEMTIFCAQLAVFSGAEVDEIRGYLNKVSEHQHKVSWIYNYVVGWVLEKEGDYDGALVAAEASLALNKNTTNLMLHGCLLGRKEDPHAIDVWREVLDRDPQSCSARYNIALNAINAGDLHNAYQYAEKALSYASTYYEFLEVGELCLSLGQYKKAICLLEKNINKKSRYEKRVLVGLSTGYYYLEKYELAADFALRAFCLDSSDEKVKEMILAISGRKKAALVRERLSSQLSHSLIGDIVYAQCELEKNNKKKAIEIASVTIEKCTSEAEKMAIGNIFYIAEAYHLAHEVYKQLVGCNYWDEGYLYALIAACDYSFKDFESSLKNAIQALTLNTRQFSTSEIREMICACRFELWGENFGDCY